MHDNYRTFVSKKNRNWPPIYNQPNRSGQLTYYVDLRAVKGGRPGFPSLQEAQARAEQARISRTNEGTLAFALPADVRLDAAKANALLAPHSVTILEAAQYYQKHVLAYKMAPTVKEIVKFYIADGETKNNRPTTVKDKRQRLGAFADDFGDRRLSDISLDELKEWALDDAWEPRTRINYLTKISQLYSFAMKRQLKWVDTNLTEHISRPEVDDTTPQIFTVQQAETLLIHAPKFGLLPYIAIGLFGGVRTAEMARLNCGDINFETKAIRIGAHIAKKRSQRIIEMQPALLAWLEPYKDKLGFGNKVFGSNFQRDRNRLVEAAGLEEWKPNGLRHSYGSYHFGMFSDDSETAKQMGNSVDTVHRFYKALVSKSDAERFWNLRPRTTTPPS